MEYKLVRPAQPYKQQHLAALAEPDAEGAVKMPDAAKLDGRTFEEWLAREYTMQDAPPDGWVPGTLYYFMDENDTLLGFLHLRHFLNENLRRVGGHIGYGLRPSARGKKLAPKMLALGLEKARALGLNEALVTCNATNLPSAATIRRCGGRLEGVSVEEDGNLVERYWITL